MAIAIISFLTLILSLGGILSIFLLKDKVKLPKINLPKIKIGLYISLGISALVFLYTLHFLVGDNYPLPRSISLGIIDITFYSIFILSGALVALALGTYKAVKAGYPRNIFEMCFYIAFPAGIVGARIWYVIAEWNKEFANRPFYHVFETWEGGMAIQGGVLLGALAGILYIVHFRKEIKIKFAADIAVPGILIAQAIGRWGNFFNIEVYGSAVPISDWWFLPRFIVENFRVGTTDTMYLPLFLIESIINTLGYFVLVYGLGKGLKKYIKQGDIAFSYLIWYGAVRLILEPMRQLEYKMGNGEHDMGASMIMSIVFVVIGILAILANHLYAYYQRKKLLPEKEEG